jgi:hypothetical protein
VQSRMRNGAIRRTARRSVAVAVLGWLTAMGASVLVAPAASAEPAVTVAIRDLTPPVVSVDAGGRVTFVNEIQDEQVQVGGAGGLLPSLVDVTVHTDVTLRLPSGTRPLPAGASITETFATSCVTCSITYAYRMDSGAGLTSAVTAAATKLLPALPVPTPFVVNTLVPLPNLPSANLPQLPQVNVPVPGTQPAPVPAPVPAPPVAGDPEPTAGAAPVPAPAAGPAPAPSIGGPTYSYGTPGTAAAMAPAGDAGQAFDAATLGVPGRGFLGMGGASAGGSGSGSGGVVGTYDGATVPTFGQLAGLDQPLGEAGADVAVAGDGADLAAPGLSVPALLAVIALAGSSTALVRAQRSRRA